MKKLIALVLALVCTASLVGCAQTPKEQPLGYLVSAQEMITNIAKGNLEEAWNPVYAPMADENLKENMEVYVELFDGREVKRCDCYDSERTGDPIANDYTETTYYKIYLTEDYSGEPDFYAKVVAIEDDEGNGIISLEILEEAP